MSDTNWPVHLVEIMTVLVCSHLFHPLCINAWLAKVCMSQDARKIVFSVSDHV